MPDTPPVDDWHVQLRRVLDEYLDDEEVQTICFDLKIDYDGLAGKAKPAKIIQLIRRCQRTNQTRQLIDLCEAMRPNVPWNEIRKASEVSPIVVETSPDIPPTELNFNELVSVSKPLKPVTSPHYLVTLTTVVVLSVVVLAGILLVNRNSNNPVQTIPPTVELTIEPTLIPTPNVVFSPTVIAINHTTTFKTYTMTVDYLKFESDRVMVHIFLEAGYGSFPMFACGYPSLGKTGYGTVEYSKRVEMGGFFIKVRSGCILQGDKILEGEGKYEGWITYSVDASKFVTMGIYTLDNVGEMPLTTFTVK